MPKPMYEQLGLTPLEYDQRLAQGYTVGTFRGRPVLIKPAPIYAAENAARRADQPAPAKHKTKRGRRGK